MTVCKGGPLLLPGSCRLTDWQSAIADPTVADAVLDRLVHNAHRIIMRGDSMRKVLADSTANES
ncbi:MAG: ATP-binding protein [bacterium]